MAKAFRGIYPVDVESVYGLVIFGGQRQFSTANEILAFVEPAIAELEARLKACEISPE